MDNLNDLVEALTQRELDILSGMAEGLTNQDIADRYCISVATVRWYTKQIYAKLNVNNRTQASIYARELGILEEAASDNSASSGLPDYHLSFVGRSKEIEEICSMLRNPQIRLVTIVGPGGIGKTRMAVEIGRQIADNFADGVKFIALGPTITTDERFLNALRRALQRPGETPFKFLESKELLLIFDNFEQSREQVHLISQLLGETKNVKVLVTSQVSMNLQQEWVRRLGGLVDLDNDDPESLADAVQLFVERVKRVRSQFNLDDHYECVVGICRLVQGMPLAIELAAVWLKTVACVDVLSEMQTNLDFLTSTVVDMEARHRSLEAVFEHTWNLLSEDERRVFKRLSVFQGEFGFTAAQQVAGATLQILSSLVDWSLVHQTRNNLYQLHGLLRHYGEQKLRIQQHGKQSNLAFTLASLIKGDFSQIETLADQFLEDSSDELNLDKGFAIAILGVIAGANEDYERCLQFGESSVLLTAESPIAALFSHLGIAIGYCGVGDYASAWTAIHQALTFAQLLQSTAFINLCLPVTAIVLASRNALHDAVAIVSLLSHHRVRLPTWMECWKVYQQLCEDIEELYAPDEFRTMWERGRSLDPHSVAQSLLDETPML